MTRLAPWLLALMLVSGSLASEDYFYDEEAEGEVAATHVPEFTSQPQTFDLMVGDEARLPCLVDEVVGAIIWESVSGNEKNHYYLASVKQTQDDRVSLETAGTKGNTLVISGVRPSDSGVYSCQVTSTPPVTLHHTVNVKYAPMVETKPVNDVLAVKSGSAASLQCMAKGNPVPTVTWTREGGVLPDGKKKMEGMELAIPKVDRDDMGSYACTVDNGVGDPVVKEFRLEVNFAPEIDAEKKVHSGAGHEAQLICTIHGQPKPEVTWNRIGNTPLDKVRHQEQHEGAQYSLTINEVHDSDLGMYTCKARNNIGTAQAPIELTGVPKEVIVTSPQHGQQKDSYTLRWNVESYAPIEEYKVVYKLAQTNKSDDDSEGGAKQQWEQIVVQAPPKEGSTVMYSHMYVLRNLMPATAYEAVVTAKNKYGSSEEPKQPFMLYTLGSPLGSTDRSEASSVRSAALAAVAALGALIAVL